MFISIYIRIFISHHAHHDIDSPSSIRHKETNHRGAPRLTKKSTNASCGARVAKGVAHSTAPTRHSAPPKQESRDSDPKQPSWPQDLLCVMHELLPSQTTQTKRARHDVSFEDSGSAAHQRSTLVHSAMRDVKLQCHKDDVAPVRRPKKMQVLDSWDRSLEGGYADVLAVSHGGTRPPAAKLVPDESGQGPPHTCTCVCLFLRVFIVWKLFNAITYHNVFSNSIYVSTFILINNSISFCICIVTYL